MSVRVMADVWDFGPENPVDCSVLVCLANFADDQGRNCFPSIPRIAKMIRRSERTVQRSLISLEGWEWISVQRGSGKGNFSQFEINIAKLTAKRRQADTLSESQRVTATTSKGDTVSPKGDSHDIAIRKNHHEPSVEPSLFASSENRSQRNEVLVDEILHKGIFELPLVDGTSYSLPQKLFNQYVLAYPAVTVMQELNRMGAWLESNPKKKKTRRGIARFIDNWLSRAQDRSARDFSEPPSPKTRSALDVLRSQGVQ